MASKGDLSLAIDLGGTNIRVAVVDRGGAVLQSGARWLRKESVSEPKPTWARSTRWRG